KLLMELFCENNESMSGYFHAWVASKSLLMDVFMKFFTSQYRTLFYPISYRHFSRIGQARILRKKSHRDLPLWDFHCISQ
ncbi:hypothetical protein P9204_10490, partial [Geobacillus stearothermophilus]|nr:hypothetical protein [Geobacillus stearothermophilus]